MLAQSTIKRFSLHNLVPPGRTSDRSAGVVRSGGKLFLNAVWLSPHHAVRPARGAALPDRAGRRAVELPAKEGGQSEYAGDS
jgi:hypothetical protein